MDKSTIILSEIKSDEAVCIGSQPLIQDSYFNLRMRQLGISSKQNTLLVHNSCHEISMPVEVQIFTENKQGGVDILYVGLNGVKIYLKNGKKQMPYVCTRLHPDHVRPNAPRYVRPKGTGDEIFIPPLVLNAYQEQSHIDTLFIVHGEFKAMKASIHNIYCIATQGIKYEEREGVGSQNEQDRLKKPQKGEHAELNTELAQIIDICQVKNLVFLFDSDCLDIDLQENRDLYFRPYSYVAAIKNLWQNTRKHGCDVYFSHLRTDLLSKGIDDLLSSSANDESLFVNDLLSINDREGKYFITQKVDEQSIKTIPNYFNISSVENFYEQFKNTLAKKKFRFYGAYYAFNGLKVELQINDEIRKYIRVGNDYYKRIFIPDKTKRLIPSLSVRTRSTIREDFGSKAFEHISRYEAFTLVPAHQNYQQAVANCYNSYHQITHQPLPGDIEYSLAMIRHIFKDKYEFGLDYMELLYTRPEQLLPILLLQSLARNTGKSTFGEWVIKIFQANATKLGNADMESDFNSTYAERLLAIVDETSISKKVTSEAIKRMSTEQGKIFVNAKGRQQYETDWIGKFIFITNTIDTALYIGKGEVRYFVRTIESLPNTDDPDMLEKLEEEIPAFLHYLSHRPLHHSRRGRMYFDFSDYRTPELGSAIEENKSSLERELISLIEDTFDAFPSEAHLLFSPSDIALELKDRSKYKVSETDIKKILTSGLALVPNMQQRYTYHSLKLSQDASQSILQIQKNGKPYYFSRERFRPEKVQS